MTERAVPQRIALPIPAQSSKDKPKRAPQPRKPRKPTLPDGPAHPPTPWRPSLETFRVAMTLALGVGIPMLSLAHSKVAGTLAAHGQYALAGFALALMLAVARGIPRLDAQTRAGVWPRGQMTQMHGKTLGIIGLGAIGRKFARLGEAIGMKIAPVLDLLTFGPLRKYHSMQAEIAGKAMAAAAKSGKTGTLIYEFDPIVTLAA